MKSTTNKLFDNATKRFAFLLKRGSNLVFQRIDLTAVSTSLDGQTLTAGPITHYSRRALPAQMQQLLRDMAPKP